MNTAEHSLAILEAWLLEMTPQRGDTAEVAIDDLRSRISSVTPAEMPVLLAGIKNALTLATAANSLWEQIASDTTGPAYSAHA
jgi:hypothetical protein